MTRSSLCSSLLFSVLFGLTLATHAQADENGWTLQSDDDSIRVYTRLLAASHQEEVKAVAQVALPADSAFNAFINFNDPAAIDPNIRKTEVLKSSETEAYIYYQFKSSWLAKDRDAVMRWNYRKTSSGGYMLEGNIAGEELKPIDPKYVRITSMNILMAFRPIDKSSVEIMYKVSVPDEMTGADEKVQRSMVNSALQTMRGLRNVVRHEPLPTSAEAPRTE